MSHYIEGKCPNEWPLALKHGLLHFNNGTLTELLEKFREQLFMTSSIDCINWNMVNLYFASLVYKE